MFPGNRNRNSKENVRQNKKSMKLCTTCLRGLKKAERHKFVKKRRSFCCQYGNKEFWLTEILLPLNACAKRRTQSSAFEGEELKKFFFRQKRGSKTTTSQHTYRCECWSASAFFAERPPQLPNVKTKSCAWDLKVGSHSIWIHPSGLIDTLVDSNYVTTWKRMSFLFLRNNFMRRENDGRHERTHYKMENCASSW